MKTEPLVTIGIPVYNGAEYLCEALDSVLFQDYDNFEIIISDNASIDRTAEICHSYQEKDKRIHYIRNLTNVGGAKNFAQVLEKAKGKYFTWLAHDDLFLSERYLRSSIDFLEQHEDVILCCCSTIAFFSEDPESKSKWLFDVIYENADWKKVRLEFFRFPPRTFISALIYGIYRTENLNKIQIKKSSLKSLPDIVLEPCILADVASMGRIVALPEFLRAYRCNLDSTYYRSLEKLSILSYNYTHLIIKWSLFKKAITMPESWIEKIKILYITLNNFIKFQLTSPNRNELKMLRKEIALLRKVCAERLDLIDTLNSALNKTKGLD